VFDRVDFESKKKQAANLLSQNVGIKKRAMDLLVDANNYMYSHQFTWLDVPVIQLPQDLFVTQEILFKTKPDLFIETGIAWGGSVLFHAGILELIGNGHLIAIDRVLPDKIKEEIAKHPFSKRITLIEGDSTDPSVLKKVSELVHGNKKVGAFLDSNHEHFHVLNELRAYGPMVTSGQYLTVYATAIEFLPEPRVKNRPWGHGNNPLTAMHEYLKENKNFSIDTQFENKLLSSFAPNGRLIRK
jgi:cephalosporin hydroxylase